MSHALAPAERGMRWRGDDFPAWLSPMLVKELRQGIQSGAFAWTFVGLQVAMFLIMSSMVTLTDDGRVRVDAAITRLVDAEAVLLQALPRPDRERLAGLLRKLSLSFDS